MLVGCAAMPLRESSLELAGYDKSAKDYSSFRAEAGGDVINLSPTVALAGGGGWLICLLCIAEVMRSKRALKSMVRAVEKLEPDIAIIAKQAILAEVLKANISDYLHKIVKRIGR